MFEVEVANDRQITVRHRADDYAWRFQVGPNTAKTQRILLSGKTLRQSHAGAPADWVIDALRFASSEARRLNMID